ncbi:LysR family transcriptional regulator [Billgrantia endophytica]|uniref:HTH lysR-type domain-containing protein n=1 Tax=Billgrantia endophytica TaxID=2033802 RepID=A0A2N7UE20_9GAMM|nr:LysR family transcriptional regulator [Halomonas endophytica]PMR78702.1 hypothetical protein C1H69_00025 [Halomonas endophytica]
MALSIESLRAFQAVAETGSFTRSAEKICKTQAAVSLQIRQLEHYLGKDLFLRERSGAKLTEHGRVLHKYASKILSAHSEVISRLSHPEPVSTIRFGIPDDYKLTCLPVLLSCFNEVFPNVIIEAEIESTYELEQLLDRGELDLAVITKALSEGEQGDKFMVDRLIWASAIDSKAYMERPLPLAIYTKPSQFYEWAISTLDAVGVKYRTAISSSDITTLHAAVSAGYAVAPMLESEISIGLKQLDVSDGLTSLPTVKVCLAYPKGSSSNVSRKLANLIADDISKIIGRKVSEVKKCRNSFARKSLGNDVAYKLQNFQ